MGFHVTAIMSYKKYIQAYIKQPIIGRRKIKGVFREKGSSKIFKNDNFDCIEFGHSNAEECYKGAIAYFNYTCSGNEKERVAVSAKWVDEEK